VRALLTQRDFLAYFAARQAAVLAASVEGVAIGWQVFLLRHSAFDLGLVGLVTFLPGLLLAIPAGYIADRYDRKLVCLVCVTGEIAVMLLFMSLAIAKSSSLTLYLFAAFLAGTVHALVAPAERSLLAGLVAAHDYVRATSITQSFTALNRIAGPAAGGLLLVAGASFAFAFAAAAYFLCALAYAILNPRGVPDREGARWSDATQGIKYIFNHQVVLAAISLDLFAVLFGGATALLPIYADTILHVGPAGLGLLNSAPAAGGTLVALYLARRPLRRNIGKSLLIVVAGFGAATIVFGASTNLWLSLGALAAVGGFDMVSMVIRSILVQLETPDAMRGRVGAVENVFIGASNELGDFESGLLASFVGAQAAVIIGGAGTLAVIAVWSVIFPALRRFDRISPPGPTQPAAQAEPR
jgi:MFS family permease